VLFGVLGLWCVATFSRGPERAKAWRVEPKHLSRAVSADRFHRPSSGEYHRCDFNK